MLNDAYGATAPQVQFSLERSTHWNATDVFSLPLRYAPALSLYTIGGSFLAFLDANNASTAWHQSGGSYLAGLAAVGIDAARIALPVAGRAFPQWRLAAFATALLCLGYSAVSSFETANTSRTDTASGRAAANDARATVAAQIKQTEADITAIGAQRSVPEVDAAIAAGEGVTPKVWLQTKRCTDVTQTASQSACAFYFDLTKERAKAVRLADLRQSLSDHQGQLAAMPAPVTVDAGANVAGIFVALTPDQARLVGSAVQIGTFEILASVLLSIAATAWAAAGSPSRMEARPLAQTQVRPSAAQAPSTPASGHPVEPEQPSKNLQPASSPVEAQWQPTGCREAQLKPIGHQWAADGPQQGFEALVRLLRGLDGEFSGTQAELARLLGATRSGAQRLLSAAAAQKLIAVVTVPGHSTTVRLRKGTLAAMAV